MRFLPQMPWLRPAAVGVAALLGVGLLAVLARAWFKRSTEGQWHPHWDAVDEAVIDDAEIRIDGKPLTPHQAIDPASPHQVEARIDFQEDAFRAASAGLWRRYAVPVLRLDHVDQTEWPSCRRLRGHLALPSPVGRRWRRQCQRRTNRGRPRTDDRPRWGRVPYRGRRRLGDWPVGPADGGSAGDEQNAVAVLARTGVLGPGRVRR